MVIHRYITGRNHNLGREKLNHSLDCHSFHYSTALCGAPSAPHTLHSFAGSAESKQVLGFTNKL